MPSDHLCCTICPVFGLSCEGCLFILRVRDTLIYVIYGGCNSRCVTARLIQKFLQADPYDVTISNRRLFQYLRSWQFVYGRATEVFPVDPEWHRWRIAKFILEYGARLRLLCQPGTHIMVYSDESYVHNNHALTMGWFCPGTTRGVVHNKRTSRFIIIHAMTEHGLLVADNEPVGIDDDLTVSRNTAEYIYRYVEPKADDGDEIENSPATRKDKVDDKDDYHHNVNADLYVKWLANRCIPAFEAKFPGKKMILVIDNASYHDAHPSDWKAVCKLKKTELIALYDKFEIDEFDAVVDKLDEQGNPIPFHLVTYERRNFAKRASPNSPEVPTAKQMRYYLSQFLKRRPELVPTQTEQLLLKHGFSILFTPPLEPRCQPIEQLWGTVKHVVAERYTVGRTAEQTRDQLMAAFYTHQYQHNALGVHGVSPRQCAAMVRESQQWMADFIKNNPDYLSGPLDNLMWESGLDERPADVEELHLLRDRRMVDREWNLESAEDFNESELLALSCLGTSMNLDSVDRINTTNAMDNDDDDEFKAPSRPPPSTMEPQLLLEQSMYPLRMHPGFVVSHQNDR